MTSIKGYTELLAAGSVGQINEMQSNFLSTIRSNVERMSALVSDLNDNAKIEAEPPAPGLQASGSGGSCRRSYAIHQTTGGR